MLATAVVHRIEEAGDAIASQLIAQFVNAQKLLATAIVAAVEAPPTAAPAASATGGGEPNFYVRASAQFVGLAAAKDAQDLQAELQKRHNQPLQDSIMGTSITGTSDLVDMRRTVASLSPSDNGAVMLIKHEGQVTARTVGVHPPVTIYSHSTTNYMAYSQVVFDENGFRPLGCATASACTSSCIDGLCICGGRLVQRIATKRVYKSKGEAECIAGQHAAARVSEQIDKETPAQLNDPEDPNAPNQTLHRKIIDPLTKWDAYPALRMSSTPEWLWIVGRESNKAKDPKSAAPAAPAVALNPAALGVQVHESFINNITEKTLGGRTVTDDEFAKGYKDMFGEEPKKAAIDDSDKGNAAKSDRIFVRDISFTAKERPVVVAFANQGFTITIRAARYGRSEYDDEKKTKLIERTELPGMEVTGEYTIHGDHADRPPLKITMTQEGRDFLNSNPPTLQKRSTAQKIAGLTHEVLARDRAKAYFTERLPEKIVFKGLEFKSGPLATHVTDVYGNLPSSQLDASQGWLTIGWRLPAAGK